MRGRHEKSIERSKRRLRSKISTRPQKYLHITHDNIRKICETYEEFRLTSRKTCLEIWFKVNKPLDRCHVVRNKINKANIRNMIVKMLMIDKYNTVVGILKYVQGTIPTYLIIDTYKVCINNKLIGLLIKEHQIVNWNNRPKDFLTECQSIWVPAMKQPKSKVTHYYTVLIVLFRLKGKSMYNENSKIWKANLVQICDIILTFFLATPLVGRG